MKAVKKKIPVISDRFINLVSERLSKNKQLRRTLPIGGRVHIDRQLPFLCIYRRLAPKLGFDTGRLIMGEASYLIAQSGRRSPNGLTRLVNRIVEKMADKFGAFLIIEIWEKSNRGSITEESDRKPHFRVYCDKHFIDSSAVSSLVKSLKEIRVRKESSDAELIPSKKTSPPGLPPVLSSMDTIKGDIHTIGIEIRPVYRNKNIGEIFPLDFRIIQRGFARALKRCFFQFSRNQTTLNPKHYHSLGRLKMVKAVSEVDSQLAELNNSFDFLLLIMPVNSNSAWLDFRRKSFDKPPEFIYRPLPIDPEILKRKLYSIPVERIEDPTLEQLFRDQQRDIDRKLSMLLDRGTQRFRYGNLILYGDIKGELVKTSEEILERIPPRSRDESVGKSVKAEEFSIRAEQEIDLFRKVVPEIRSKVFVRDDITGLMVSQGNLFIGKHIKVPVERIEALIQHEVGTHILTYVNGKGQIFKQLYSGLPGYEELQEGLAVLSEYMTGGLSRPRLRLLAARVIAARDMLDNASFTDVFRKLTKEYHFNRQTAFSISLRTFRSGGSIKDHIYLKGLINLMEYLKQGGEFEQLFIGKIGIAHVGIIKELRWRNILKPPPLLPSYMNASQTREKIEEIRNGLTIFDLIKRRKK